MYQRWQKRDPVKNYFMVPNEVFSLGLNSDEIHLPESKSQGTNRQVGDL